MMVGKKGVLMEYKDAYIYFDEELAIKKAKIMTKETREKWIIEKEDKFYRVRKER